MQRALDTAPAANVYPVLDLLSRRACASHLDNAKLRAVVQEKVCMAHHMAAAMVPLARAWARPASAADVQAATESGADIVWLR
jgi:hypothetical protein